MQSDLIIWPYQQKYGKYVEKQTKEPFQSGWIPCLPAALVFAGLHPLFLDLFERDLNRQTPEEKIRRNWNFTKISRFS